MSDLLPPRPWAAKPGNQHIIDPTGREIASVPRYKPFSKKRLWTDDEIEAIKALIAAAPDLLYAAEEVIAAEADTTPGGDARREAARRRLQRAAKYARQTT